MSPSIGRIVHYVQEKPARYQPSEGPKLLVHLPAIITVVWSDTCVNLMVFSDGSNSEADDTNFRCTKWVTSPNLDESETPQALTWHWPEKV